MNEELFKTATRYLEGEGSLPEKTTGQDRLVIVSAMLKDIHEYIKVNAVAISGVDKRVTILEQTKRSAESTLKWLGAGLGTVGVILGILAKLGVI